MRLGGRCAVSEHIKSRVEVLPPRPKTIKEKTSALVAPSEEEKKAPRGCP